MTYTIQNGQLSVSVKRYGAELSSLKSMETGIEYLWQGDPDVWYGQSPVLFPIVGTLLDNKYRVDGKEYELFRHGLARKRDFDVKAQSDGRLILTQRWNEETLKQYPFRYEFDIAFLLDGKTLTVEHTIRNLGDGTMYFSVGAHPGFNCEIGDVLEFEQEEDAVVNEMIDEDSILYDRHFPSPIDGKIFTISAHIFDKDAHVLSHLKSKSCTLKHQHSAETVEFTFGDAPYLGLWAKPGAPYVCIEPWYGINDNRDRKADFSQKRAIEQLAPGEAFTFRWSAKISE